MRNMTYSDGNILFKKNDTIFLEGQTAQSINILLQGSVDVYISLLENSGQIPDESLKNSLKIFTIDQNVFIGANDLFLSGKHAFSYRASTDASLYVFSAKNIEQVEALMQAKKDYAAHINASIVTLMDSAYIALNKLDTFNRKLSILLDNLSVFFWTLKEKLVFSHSPAQHFLREGLDKLQKLKDSSAKLPSDLDISFFETDFSEALEAEYISFIEVNKEKLKFYKHLSSLPVELRKSYFSSDLFITNYQCREAAGLLGEIQACLKEAVVYSDKQFKLLYSEEDDCLFSEFARAAIAVKKSNPDAYILWDTLDYIRQKIKEIASMYQSEYNYSLEIDIAALDSKFMPETDKLSSIDMNDGIQNLPEILKDSAKKILDYSELPEDKAQIFLRNLEAFRNLDDKFEIDSIAGNIRRTVSALFFEVYEAVFKKVLAENNQNRLYRMFLNYAYMDEKLLDPQHTLAIYKLTGKSPNSGSGSIHLMTDWLTQIYNKEKEPSINDFDQDYYDVFREMKKQGEATDQDKADYDKNQDAKLSFEIRNMFRINQRLCHGQLSVYFPILHNDMITRDLSKALVTVDKLNDCLNRILSVDFSAFHREISYRDSKTGIEKEYIMKQVMPDIILMPIFGSRAIMWQELAGRVRSTPARFIIPVFADGNLDELMIKLVGNFRWDLCRTMMGGAWNDVMQSSLTSDYTDYIQFYKKNRDLSEEAKDKIKQQLQKSHNGLRDIFTSDYEIWINYEAKGITRLNKVVRKILYKHCPFAKPIRDTLEKHPLFSELAIQAKIIRTKKAKEIENRYTRLVGGSNSLDQDLQHNLKFYKEM